jgi:hypothetical protein
MEIPSPLWSLIWASIVQVNTKMNASKMENLVFMNFSLKCEGMYNVIFMNASIGIQEESKMEIVIFTIFSYLKKSEGFSVIRRMQGALGRIPL